MGLTRPKLAQVTTTTSAFDDPIIVLNNNPPSGSNTYDIGIVFERGDDQNRAFLWDESADEFVLVNTTEQGSTNGDVTLLGYANLHVNNLVAEGTITMNGNVQLGDSASDTITFNGEYTFPTVDGSADQYLKTDGSGNLSWSTVASQSASSAAPSSPAYGQEWYDTDDGAFYKYLFDGTSAQWVEWGPNNSLDGSENIAGNMIPDTDSTHDIGSNTIRLANIYSDTFVGALTGNVTGDVTGNLTGNASTATQLATARTIAGQSFDGTANISIAPTDLTGVTATAAELNYTDGVTSNIQTQLDTKSPTASPTFTGTVTIPTLNINSAYTLPTSDGTNGQVLSTNGSGTISFVDVATTLDAVTDNGATTTNDISVGGITVSGNIVPSANETYSLGTAENRFSTLHVAESTVYLGDIALSIVSGELYVDGNPVAGAGDAWPGYDGDYDLKMGLAQTTPETDFEDGGEDAFGVPLALVFDNMEPGGQTITYDYADGEAYVGAA